MPKPLCPSCHAEIEDDLLESTGRAVCPFCGADLAELGLAAGTRSEVEQPVGDDLAPPIFATVTRDLPPVPASSKLHIVESTADRLVLFLPPGSKQAEGLGCIALAWNLFLCIFTPLWFVPAFGAGGKNGPPLLVIVPFLSIFWAVGLGMLYFYLRMKYQRTFLLLDRERIVVQRVLFGRKRLDETLLAPGSRAELVESYSQNDVPVYRVEVKGQNRAAKFGTPLSNEEKDWLVDRINEFLGVADSPVEDDPVEEPIREPARVEPEPLPVIDPASLPADGDIEIEESTREHLRFNIQNRSGAPLRWLSLTFAVPFTIFWYGMLFTMLGTMFFGKNGVFNGKDAMDAILGVCFGLFFIPFFVAGLLPVGTTLFYCKGRATVDLTREKLTCRWHLGRVGYSRSVPTATIEKVGVESVSQTKTPRHARTRAQSLPICVVRAGPKSIWLTVFRASEDPNAAMHQIVASLLRAKLAEMGHVLKDA